MSSLLFLRCSSNETTTSLKEKTLSSPTKLIWSDEFDKDGLPDPQKWTYDVGDACDQPAGCGWGNNERQYYTKGKEKNVRIKNGYLIIEAHQEKINKSDYSSTRLISKNKGDFKYGRIEVRAKLPSGKGTWPAIWMLPTNSPYGGWPRSGEIDIMEHVGYEPDTIYGTPHTQAFNGMIGTHKTGSIYVPDAESSFHTYTVEWTANKIEWYVDDIHYHTFAKIDETPEKWPFDQAFHLILNLAVGGNWGGKYGIDESIWPQQFLIDYVRVYKIDGS